MTLADDGRLAFGSHQDLSVYDLLRTPIWIFDVDRHRMWWGNAAALEFWGADSVADLQEHDFSSDSEIVKQRLRQIVSAEQAKFGIEESWTLFLLGKPTTIAAKITPVRIESGRKAILVEATGVVDLSADRGALRLVEAARISNSRLMEAIEAIPDGFSLFDADDRLVLFNQRYHDVYPKHAEALVTGGRFEDMLRAGVQRGEFADAIGREEEWIAERMRLHRNPQGPIEQRLSDGRWLRTEERRTCDGEIVGLRTDITKQKELEQKLKASEERFRDFAWAAADWFWEMDADLRFTYMSENVERIVGVPPAWHYGKTREELLGDDYDRDAWEAHLACLRAHKPFRHFVYQRVGKGVETKWLSTSGLPLFNDDGTFAGYRGIGSDITEQKRAEERLRASEEQLFQAQKMEAIGQLTGGIAHDFNNLLAVIQGNLELIEEAIKDPRLEAMIAAALRSVARGAQLTEQLLMFGRKAFLRPEVINLNDCLQALAEMIRRTIPAKISIEFVLAEDLWPVELDQAQFEAAILNIVINARDAMPDGGQLVIETENIARSGKIAAPGRLEPALGRYVVVKVRDTGHGMKPETAARAYEPFFTTKPVGQGSGLGLSMVHGFAHQSEGDVVISSREGKGTEIRLCFPASEKAARAERLKQGYPMPRARRGETILLVEDEAEVCAVVAEQLRSLGYRVAVAGDGAKALAMLKGNRRIDLVLTDLTMPGPL